MYEFMKRVEKVEKFRGGQDLVGPMCGISIMYHKTNVNWSKSEDGEDARSAPEFEDSLLYTHSIIFVITSIPNQRS